MADPQTPPTTPDPAPSTTAPTPTSAPAPTQTKAPVKAAQEKAQPPISAVVMDPKFLALPFRERVKVLQKMDPRFAALPMPEQIKAARKLDPDSVKQSKLSAFALGTSAPGREPVDPTYWGVVKWMMKETGAGVWDAWKGAGQLLNEARMEFLPMEGDVKPPAEKSLSYSLVKQFVDAAKQTPNVIPALIDLAKNPYGPAAVAEAAPRAVGQYVGSEMLGKAIKTTTDVAGTIMEKGLKPTIQDYVAGAGPGAAQELATQTREAFIGTVEEVRAKNAKLKGNYDAAVKTATEERIQAEERYKVAVDRAQKEHAANELAEKQEHEKTIKAQKEEWEKKVKEQEAEHGKKVAQQGEDYQKKLARQQRAHEKLAAKVQRQNEVAVKEHAEATKRVEEVNKAEAEKVGKRAELAGKIKQDSTTLGAQLKEFYGKAKAYGKTLYAPVDEATEGMSIPVQELANDVEHAQTNLLLGSDESIKQFQDILKRSESDADPELKEDEADPRGFSYQQKLEAGEPITFHDMQGYYTELGKKLYGSGSSELLGDVRSALRYVRNALGKKMMKMAREAEVGDELKAAMDYHTQLASTFYDMSPVKTARNIGQRAGSPVARAIRAQDPQYIRDPFLNPAYGERAGNLIRQFEEHPELKGSAGALLKTIEGIARDFKDMSGLPKKAKVEDLPSPPKLKEAPEPHEAPEPPRPIEPPKTPELKLAEAPQPKPFEKPVFNPPDKVIPPDVPDYAKDPEAYSTEALAEHLKDLKKKKVGTQAKKFQTMNKWDTIAWAYGAYQAVEELMAGKFPLPKAWAYTLGHWGAGKLMEMPKINKWLTDVTPADIEILNRTYAGNPLGKAEAQAAMTTILSKSGQKLRPSVVSALGKFLTKPQLLGIIKTTVKGVVAGQTESARKSTEDQQKLDQEYLQQLDHLRQELIDGSPQ